jgi:hypothetical protein
MKIFNKGILGKASLFSVFLFFLLFVLIFVNMSVANPLIYSFDRILVCDGCEELNVPSDTEVNILLNISVIHFKDEPTIIKLIDTIPTDWDITDSNEGKITTSGYSKTIEWSLDLNEYNKQYESDLYDIIKVQKSYTVKSPFITENKAYNFVSKLDGEIGTTKVNVYPIERNIQTEQNNENEIIQEQKELKPEQIEWKDKIEEKGYIASIIESGEKYTTKIEKNNIIVEFEDIENVNWNEVVEVTQNINENKINEFLSQDNLKLKDFVWVDSNGFAGNYNAKIILPSTYESVFYCEGIKEYPDCYIIEECGKRPCYQEINGKTILYLNHFSGGGGADPTNQYNQDGSPLIVNGTWSSGSAINLNTLGEDATYDILESGSSGCAPNCPTNIVVEGGYAVMGTTITSMDIPLTYTYNLSKSFIVSRFTGGTTVTNDQEPDETHKNIEFVNSTHIRITRYATQNHNSNASYFVIQADNIIVWNFTNDWSAGVENYDVALSSSLPSNYESKCFIELYRNTRVNANVDNYDVCSHVLGNITNTTHINLQRSHEGSYTCPVGRTVGYVVCFLDNTNVTANYFSEALSASGAYKSIGKSINTTNSWMTFNYMVNNDGLGQVAVRGQVYNSTHTWFDRATATGTVSLRFYVIEFEPGGFVQHRSIAGVDTYSQTDTITAVNISRSFIWASEDCTGTGTLFPRPFWINVFDSNTQVEMWHSYTGQTSNHEYQVVTWPSITSYETGEGGKYNVEVWHNSTQISFTGQLSSVNATINFTTDVDDFYSLYIYDWENSQWISSGCDSGSVTANTPTQWWCNISTNPMYYNSSDGIIRIRLNSTADSDAGLLKEDYIQYYVSFMDYPPEWQDNYTSVTSDSQYIQGRNYGFEIKWTDPDQGDSVDEVTFEWDDSNYTQYTAPAVQNSGNTYWINLTDLATGDYNYKWYANDSYDIWNNTSTLTYSVAINTSTEDFMNLTIGTGTSGTESNYQDAYPVETNATGWYSSIFDGQNIQFNLYFNDTSLGSSNPVNDIETYGVGLYMYTYNTSGNENYSSASKQYNLTVQQNQTNPVNLYFRNETGEYLNQNITVDYENQTNATGVAVYSDSGTINLYRDEIDVTSENGQNILLGSNTIGYAYKANITGNENYSANDTGITYHIIINKKQTTTYLWINSSRSNYGFTQDDYANFTVELVGYPSKTVELWTNYSDGSWKLWDSGVSPYENITQLTTTGTFEFLGNYSGDENYTYSEESWIAKVSSLSLVSAIASMSPTSINQSQNSTVIGNCSCEGGTCNNAYIEIQSDGQIIFNTSGYSLQANGSNPFYIGTLGTCGGIMDTGECNGLDETQCNLNSACCDWAVTKCMIKACGDVSQSNCGSTCSGCSWNSWKTRSWNITGWMPGTYEIKIKCNSTETGNSFSNVQNLEVNDTENPTWSENATSHSSGIEYLKNRQYQFNVTWNDNKQIDKVLIEHNFTGGAAPHNDTVSNENGVYYFDVSDLPAGTYVWKEYANDTTDNQNITNNDEYWIFTIEKGPTEVTLYLNESTSDQTSYYPNSTINVTAVSNISELYVQIWRNGTLIANSTGSTFNITQWPAWNNNFTAQVLGNENNTDSSPVTLWWNVSKGSVPLTLENNVSWSDIYPASTNTTSSGCPSQLTCNLSRNDTGLIGSSSNPISDIVLLGAGGYNYTYNTSGNENYSANVTSNVLTIYKANVQPILVFNTTLDEIYPTATSVSCSVDSYNNEVICNLYRNDTGIVSNPDEELLGAGSYQYVTNTTETANYSTNSTGDMQVLVIEKNPTSSISLFLNSSQSNFNLNYNSYLNITAVLNTPAAGNIEIWTNYSDGSWNLWDSCSDCSSLENVTLMAWSGIWNFTANFTHQNYTDAYESWYANVKDLNPPNFYYNSTNSTTAGYAVEHSLYWQDDKGLSGYIFSWNNGTNWTDMDCSSLYDQDSCQSYGCTWTPRADYNQTILNLDPEARWILNSDGTDFVDGHSAGSGSSSFVTSIIPNPPLPNCGDFDGSSNQYNIPDDIRINTGTGYLGGHRALSVWIVADTIDTTGNGRGIWTEGGTTNSLNMYVYDNGTSTNIYCNAVESSGTNNDWVSYPISTGVSYHVGCMFDFYGAGKIDMYINGTLVDSDTSLAVGTNLSSHGNNNAIGGVDQNTISHNGSQISGNFDGRIADLIYWSDDHIISQSDFQAIYETGENSGDCSGTSNYELKNDTWIPMTSAGNWSNTTKIVNDTVGATIKWCVYANDTSDNWNSSCTEPFSYITTPVGYLEVELVTPPGNTIVEVYKNFTVNATVYCKEGDCGDIYGTVRYNLTSANPDTPVNITYGDEPFFVNETPAYALKLCSNNMQQDDFCNVTWNINATGIPDSEWKIGVLFNSSYFTLPKNHTNNITITIVSCIEELTLPFSNVGFGSLFPSTEGNQALENANNKYNVTNSGSCISDIWIKASDLVNGTNEILYNNISFNNVTNSYSNSYRISNNYSSQNSSLKLDVPGSTNATSYYFLDVPAIYAGNYTGNLIFCLNSSAYPSLCE